MKFKFMDSPLLERERLSIHFQDISRPSRSSHQAIVRSILLTMRITTVIMLVTALHVSSAGLSQKINFTGTNVPLSAVFNAIEEQTGYGVIMSHANLATSKPVTVAFKDATLDEVLTKCFSFQESKFRYSITGHTISIAKVESIIIAPPILEGVPGRPPEFIGIVSSEDGKPLVGATVEILKLNKKGLTNEKGEFFFSKIPDGKYKVEITFVGYEKYQTFIEIGENPVRLTAGLRVSSSKLDEVQVIAYGTTTQRLSTGDVTTVKAVDIEKAPVSNVLAAIEGRVPGMIITQNSGMPGGSFTVKIRGRNSIANGNDPFYVIDGVPYISQLIQNQNPAGGLLGGSPLDFINPADIESIDVLKDADATAIYGSRGANGVILITTKKGKSGKTRFDLNMYEGMGKAPLKSHWLNTSDYLKMRNEAFQNDGVIPSADPNNPAYAPDLLVWDTTRYTNWQKLLAGNTAHYTDIQANFSGGNANTQYVFGGGYHRESTVFPFSSGVPHASIHFNITNSSDDQRFKITITGNYSETNSHLPSTDLSPYFSLPPDAPSVYNKDGSVNLSYASWAGLQNPLAFTYRQYKAHTDNLVGNAILSYRLWKVLDIKASVGYTKMQANDIITNPIAAQDPSYSPKGNANYTNSNFRSWIVEPQATYQLLIGRGKINALVGATFQQNTSSGESLTAFGFTSDVFLENIQAAPGLIVQGVTDAAYKYNALFGRLNYNLEDKWLLDLTWRRDGSSRFGSDRQFHDFGSGGAAWIFTKENWVKNKLPFVSFGKLRASYGTTGSDQIGDYRYYNLFQTTPNSYQGTTGLTPFGLNNPDLAWELTKKAEVGLELGFVKDRILGQVNYYQNRSSNQLLSESLPSVAGFTSIPLNRPATVQNTGWEFMLNTVNIKSKNFSWTTSINLTLPYNKLLAYPNLSTSPDQYSLIIGKPVGIVQLFHYVGVDPQTGVYQFVDSKGSPTFTPSYLTDRTSIEYLSPKTNGGLQNSFSFKGWQLDIFFHFRIQKGPNYLLQSPTLPGQFNSNQPVGIMNRWQHSGDDKPIQQFTQSYSSNEITALGYVQNSDYYWVDASFIRLANLSVSYQIPSVSIRKMHFQSCRVYLHSQNLLTITKYKGMDPENQNLAALPPLRVVTGGISLSL